MNIKLLSDLHLEFGSYDVGEGDVLILAGDIVNVEEMKKESPQGKYYIKFLEKCANSYKKVFMVLGNHEHYFGDIEKTAETLKTFIDVEGSNITLLDNTVETYEGVNFIGGTLWTDYNGEDPDAKLRGLNAMTDYHVIVEGDLGKLVPNSVIERHKDTLKFLDETLPTLEGDTVVVTHHAPHQTSLSGDYVDNDLSPAYYTDLGAFIEKHKPQVWCHGHIHHTNDYKLGDTRVLSNPRGYRKYNENPDFNPEFTFTLGVPVVKLSQDQLPEEAEPVTVQE